MLSLVLSTIFFYILTRADASCTEAPHLPDGIVVPTATTHDGGLVTPDCESVGLISPLDLKCVDGQYWLVDPSNPLHTIPANNSPFCIDPRINQSQTEAASYDMDVLRKFWKQMKEKDTTEVLAMKYCPRQAVKCIKFDFSYVPGRFDEQDSYFLGLELDAPATLEYRIDVDVPVREFDFAHGLGGRIIELDGEVYAELNTDDREQFALFIRPCGSNVCEYMMFLERPGPGHTGEAKEQPEFVLERPRRDEQRKVNDELLQARLDKVSDAHNRRLLGLASYVSITFLYDNAIQSRSDARNKAVSSVLGFNQALNGNTKFNLFLSYVIQTDHNKLNPSSQSCCGVQCDAANIIKTRCQQARNALASKHRGDLTHCFVRPDAYFNPVTGCASKNGVGVSDISSQSSTVLHELGHQMGADHKENCWMVCVEHVMWWCVREEERCTLMNPYHHSGTQHTFHDDSVQQMNENTGFANNNLNDKVFKQAVPGNGWCVGDDSGPKARKYVTSSLENAWQECKSDANCAGIAYSPSNQRAIIYTTNGCTNGCQNTAWVNNPHKIKTAQSTVSAWADATCYRKATPTFAGNAPSNRNRQDSGRGMTIVSEYSIQDSGTLVAWEFYAFRADTIVLTVWRKTSPGSLSYTRVGKTTHAGSVGLNHVQANIPVQQGDVLGWFCSGKQPIKFSNNGPKVRRRYGYNAHTSTVHMNTHSGGWRRTYSIRAEINPSLLGDDCVAYSIEACETAANALGLQIGGGGYSFSGDYITKGCYAYSQGSAYAGIAFYGNGGTASQRMAAVTLPQYRPNGHDCTGSSAGRRVLRIDSSNVNRLLQIEELN